MRAIFPLLITVCVTILIHELPCLPLVKSNIGAVCVRVPSSLKAGVELCGTSVDISPAVALHKVQNNTTDGQTTITGEQLNFIASHSLAQFIYLKTHKQANQQGT